MKNNLTFDEILFFSIIIFIFFELKHNYTENFTGDITTETCLQRILDDGCINIDEKESINNDCSDFSITMPHGNTNISCDNEILYNWLICQQMIRNGACECQFGRNQIKSLCGENPLNLNCPLRLISPNNEVYDKIKELEKITLTCDNIETREDKVKSITNDIESLIQQIENENNSEKEKSDICLGNYISLSLIPIICFCSFLVFIISLKKKK
jgi:hypothetical protein